MFFGGHVQAQARTTTYGGGFARESEEESGLGIPYVDITTRGAVGLNLAPRGLDCGPVGWNVDAHFRFPFASAGSASRSFDGIFDADGSGRRASSQERRTGKPEAVPPTK